MNTTLPCPPPGPDAARRWQAVLARDATYDQAFVYAVRSTGIYCRPSCPARRPQPAQVVFYDDPAAAEAAGFRACLRCGPAGAAQQQIHVHLIEQVCQLIAANLEQPLTLTQLGSAVGLSPYHLQRTFKRVTGLSPRAYAAALRLGHVKAHLREPTTIATAVYAAGYGSNSRFYTEAPAALGMTPTTYQRGGLAMIIQYRVVPCHLGYLLVATTERGVCAVSLGSTPAVLAAELRAEYPAASLQEAPAAMEDVIAAVLAHLAGQTPHLELDLDVQATAFQRQVWAELQRIPYGETRSYGAVAAALGQPGAARAVARACATNPVALVIPCHRVVRENGALGGYRWDVERKRALLTREHELAPEALPQVA